MNTSRMLSKCLALILLLGGLIGCEKTVTEQVQPTNDLLTADSKAKVTQLLERALQEGTPEEYAAITAVYKSLSSEELALFNTLRMESETKRVTQKLAKVGARVSQEQSAMVTQALQQVNSLREAVNKRSLALYGVPYNQVADSLVNKLVDQEAQNYWIDMPNLESMSESEPGARVSQPMDCSSASFPYVSRKINYGNLGWNYWGTKRTPGTDDCDYEFRYSGYNINFDPKDWFADRLCDSFNNTIARRSNSTYTRLLFGNRGVWLWIGYPGLTSVDMYD